MEECKAYMIANPNGRLAEQDFARQEKLEKATSELMTICRTEMDQSVASLRTFLESPTTISILLPPLQAKIVDEYMNFRDLVSQQYPREVLESLVPLSDLWDLLREICKTRL